MYTIDVDNSQDQIEIDAEFFRNVVERTLAEEQVAGAVISLAIVDNAAIRRLNQQYLEHDYETDVLSFLLECDRPAGAGNSPRGRGQRVEGEVIVSAEMAVQRAVEFAWTSGAELMLYCVHGLLHLVGYDDRSAAERRLMRQREQEILKLWDLAPQYAEPRGAELSESPLSGADS